MNITHKVLSSIEETRSAAAKAIETSLSNHPEPILFLLSGGSALSILDHINPEVLDERMCISVLDERFSSDPSLNNWLQVTQTQFYQECLNRGVTMIETVPKTQEKIDQFATRWQRDLQKWVKSHPKRFTLASLGIGADGHIAGISPFPQDPQKFLEFLFTSDWTKGYSGNLTPPERVTVTATFLEEKIDKAVVYITGENKKEALQAIQADAGRLADTPARILREMKDVEIFTDIK